MTTTNPLSRYRNVLIGLAQHAGDDGASSALEYGITFARKRART